MRTKHIMIGAIAIALLAAAFFLTRHFLGGGRATKGPAADATHVHDEEQAEYWTCSMHPSVRQHGPGKCPICGMDLIPVRGDGAGTIAMDGRTAEKLGISSAAAERVEFMKELRLSAKVSHDYELYMLEQKHLSALAAGRRARATSTPGIGDMESSILKSTRLRLKLLGFDDGQIARIERLGKPDESLIYPSKGKAWIHADVYEQDIGYVKKGLPVEVKIQGLERRNYTGTIAAVETVLNEKTRSAKARIEVPDPDNQLRHEMYADVMVTIDLGRRLGIPRKSLIDTGTRKVVYIDMGDHRYEIRQVETGVVAGNLVEVVGGVKEGERVVAEGNFLLDSQTTLGGGEALMYDAGEEIKKDFGKDMQHRH